MCPVAGLCVSVGDAEMTETQSLPSREASEDLDDAFKSPQSQNLCVQWLLVVPPSSPVKAQLFQAFMFSSLTGLRVQTASDISKLPNSIFCLKAGTAEGA